MDKRDLIEMMRAIENKAVVSYYPSFLLDANRVEQTGVNENALFIWMVRSDGTYLIKVNNSINPEKVFDHALQHFEDAEMYQISCVDRDWQIEGIDEEGIREMFDSLGKYLITCTNDYGYERYFNFGMFDTRELAVAKAMEIAAEMHAPNWNVSRVIG